MNVRTCAILSEFFRYKVKQALHDNATFCLEQGKVATDGVDELVCDYEVDDVSGEIVLIDFGPGDQKIVIV